MVFTVQRSGAPYCWTPLVTYHFHQELYSDLFLWWQWSRLMNILRDPQDQVTFQGSWFGPEFSSWPRSLECWEVTGLSQDPLGLGHQWPVGLQKQQTCPRFSDFSGHSVCLGRSFAIFLRFGLEEFWHFKHEHEGFWNATPLIWSENQFSLSPVLANTKVN